MAHREIVVTSHHPRSICSVRIEGCRKQLLRLPACFCKRWLLRRILPEVAPVFVLKTERGNQLENGGAGIVHVRWSAAEAIRFTKMEPDRPHMYRPRLNTCQVFTLCKD